MKLLHNLVYWRFDAPFKPRTDPMLPSLIAQTLLTLVIGSAGAGLAWLVGFPAPFLIGPALLVTLASLSGLQMVIGTNLRNLTFILLGVILGQTVTPDIIDAAMRWPVSLACLAVMLVVIIELTMLMLTRYWKMEKTTALLSASPGHLSYVLGLTEGVRGDTSAVSIIQSIRLLSLILLVPLFVTATGPLPQVGNRSPDIINPLTLIAVLLVAALASWGLMRLRLPAAFLMGGLLVSASLHVTGMVSGHVPAPLAVAGFIILGSLIGTRFSGVTLLQLRGALGAGLAVTAVSFLTAALFACLAAWLTGFSVIALMIAFAPGGIETMSAMAVLLAIDPTFVAAHHVFRLLLLTVIVPTFVLRRQGR